MTGTKCDLFTHKSSRSYLNHLVYNCLTLRFLDLTRLWRPSEITLCLSHGKRHAVYMKDKSYVRYICIRGYAVAQLFVALHYEPEGREFDSRWSHWNLSVT